MAVVRDADADVAERAGAVHTGLESALCLHTRRRATDRLAAYNRRDYQQWQRHLYLDGHAIERPLRRSELRLSSRDGLELPDRRAARNRRLGPRLLRSDFKLEQHRRGHGQHAGEYGLHIAGLSAVWELLAHCGRQWNRDRQ